MYIISCLFLPGICDNIRDIVHPTRIQQETDSIIVLCRRAKDD